MVKGLKRVETGLGVRVRRCAGIYHYLVSLKIRGVRGGVLEGIRKGMHDGEEKDS